MFLAALHIDFLFKKMLKFDVSFFCLKLVSKRFFSSNIEIMVKKMF